MDKIMPIVLHPNDVLRKTCAPVANVDENVRQTLLNMQATLHGAHGIGLAAPQVGLTQRLVVIDGPDDKDGPTFPELERPLLMVNPTILEASEEMIDSEEGCLSIPRVFDVIRRHAWVKVGYVDEQGDPREVEGEGLLSRCLQHEIDHLNGVLFFDHLSKLKRELLLKRYFKILPEFLEDGVYPILG